MMQKFEKERILFGKGAEYCDVALEIEMTFQSWLSFSGIDQTEFDRRMSFGAYRIEEGVNDSGDIEINIYAGGKAVAAPLLFPRTEGASMEALEDFLVNAILLLAYISSQRGDKEFDSAVKGFAGRMIAERKLVLE